MSFNFLSIEHAVASVAHDVVVAARAVAGVLPKVVAQEQTVEAVTALVAPQAVIYERAAFLALGFMATAAKDVTDPSTGKLLIKVDTQTISDFKALFEVLKNDMTMRGLLPSPAPAAPPAAQ